MGPNQIRGFSINIFLFLSRTNLTMKRKSIYLLILLLNHTLFAQNRIKQIDSLKREIKRTTKTELKGELEYKLALEYYDLDSLNKAEELFRLAEEKISKDNLLYINFLTSKANLYSVSNRYVESDSLFLLSELCSKNNNIDTLFHSIKAKEGVALNNLYKGNIQKALEEYNFLEKRIEKLDTLNFEKLKMYQGVIGNKAIVLANYGKIEEALVYFKKGLRIQEKLVELSPSFSKKELINVINNIALCYDLLNRGKESIDYYLKGIEIARKYQLINSEKLLSVNLSRLFNLQKDYIKAIEYGLSGIGTINNYNFTGYNNVGLAYMRQKKYNESRYYFDKALKVAKKLNTPLKMAVIYSNIGEGYSYSKELDSAIYYGEKAIKIYNKIGQKKSLASVNHLLGRVYFDKENFKKSLNYLTKAEREFFKHQSTHINHINNRRFLYKIYKKRNDYKESLLWLEKFNDLKNEYDSIRHRSEVNDLEVKFKTKQKENKILNQQREIQEKEISLEKSKRKINLVIGGVFLFTVFGGVYLNRRKREEKIKLLKTKVNSGEKERQRIGRELHDGIASNVLKLSHQIKEKDEELSSKLYESYNEIRSLSHQLNNMFISGELFVDRIFELIPDSNRNKVYDLKIEPLNLELNELLSSHLYRITQELITNNIKHSEATETLIEIRLEGKDILLFYKDNGVGLSDFNKGTGMKNIEDRLKILNGVMRIESTKGLEIEIKLPYK